MNENTPNDNTPNTNGSNDNGSNDNAQAASTVPMSATPGAVPGAVPGAAQHASPDVPAFISQPAAEQQPRTGRKRGLLIGGGMLAAILLAGGGVAIGAAIADEGDDDHPSMSDGQRLDDDRSDDGTAADRDDRDDDQNAQQGTGQEGTPQEGTPQEGTAPQGTVGTASADDLVAIASAARNAAEGDVTSIDAKRDGSWEVTLETAAGDETEVRVAADLSTTISSTDVADGDDIGPTLILDDATIRSLVAAALSEAEGLITDLDVDDDTSRPYDVSVLTNDNRSIDIDLDASFAVVSTDLDD